MKKKFNPVNLWLIPASLLLIIPIHLFVGNPVSKIIAGNTLQNYVEEKYPDCYFEEYSYDFTCNGYSTVVCSNDNPDIRFVVQTDTFGFTIQSDSYNSSVESGSNTERRLIREYTGLIEKILGNEICDYKIFNITGSFTMDGYLQRYQYALKSGPLIPGKEYDIYEISPTDGDISLRVIAPGATMETAEKILNTAKQKLDDAGIIFDTISLSIGENADCWPYVINIERLPYSIFSQSDFSQQIQEVHLPHNPQWSLAFNRLNYRYDSLLKSVNWQQTENFVLNGIKAHLSIEYELADIAYGNLMYTSVNGIDIDDIDVINYKAYTDLEIADFGRKAGHITVNVIAPQQSNQAIADIINEINRILKDSGLENRQTDLIVSYENTLTVHSFPNLYYSEEPFTDKDIARYNQI